MSRAAAACAVVALGALAACGRFGFSPDAGDAAKLAGSDAIADGNGFPADWWDTAYAHRSRIDIHGSMLNVGVTDFPLYVRLDPSGIDLGAVNAAGSDLRFIGSDGQTVLDYDIELADGSGFDVWVHIPEIRGRNVDDVAWVYYGNPAATAPLSGENVWDSSYVAVWHMSTDRDATHNHNDGTYTGTVVAPGVTRNARQMPVGGTSGSMLVPDSPTFDSLGSDGNATWEGWMTTPAPGSGLQSLIEKDLASNGTAVFLLGVDVSNNVIGSVLNVTSNSATVNGSTPVATAAWTHVAMTWGANTITVFINGTAVVMSPLSGTLRPDGDQVTIGGGCFNCGLTTNTHFAEGSLDEVRVETVAHDHTWFAAEVANMTGPLVTVTPADP